MDIKNIDEIRKRIEHSAEKSGRSPEDITLVAVTKTVPAQIISQAIAHGITDIGENRVQELVEKFDKVPPANIHLIGHLQTNKVKHIIDKVHLIHSVDSLHLAQEINRHAEAKGIVKNILIQVNVSGEMTKYGVAPENLLELVKNIAELKMINVRGFMTIPPLTDDKERSRKYFAKLKEISLDINEKILDNICSVNAEIDNSLSRRDTDKSSLNRDKPCMDMLSMGMSNDFETAIEEGANIIRVGAAIFGRRKG